MSIANKNAEHMRQLGEATGSLIASPVESLVGMITGENPKAIRTSTRSFIGTLLKTPFRIAGSTAWGLTKGTAGLAWNLAKNAPILPFTPKETRELVANTRKDLGTLGHNIFHHNLFAGNSPEESLSTAA